MVRRRINEDRISELPDDIIDNIISRLTLKQAAATSLISTRWTDLWKFYSGCFDFDGSNIRSQWIVDKTAYSRLVRKRRDFVDWVNHVLPSHQGTTMEGLRIIFDLEDLSPEVIDTWVQLALAKRVQFIELDLRSFSSYRRPSIEYDFPIRSHCGFLSLKSLVFTGVNISGDALESLVDKCPNLENLSITGSYSIEVLKRSIEVLKLSSLSLKQLTLWLYKALFEIKISAPNLLSFAWAGSVDSNLVLQDVPQLKYVRISCHGHHIQSHPFQTHHSQVVTLELDYIALDYYVFQNLLNFNITELSNLIHLKMKLRFIDDLTFRLIVAYLKASPSLENFTLVVGILSLTRFKSFQVYMPVAKKKLTETALNMIENHCYKNLKTVKFKGFGVSNDVEFITHLVNHAPLLEKIIIDPRLANFRDGTYFENRDRAINFSASLSCQVIVV